METFVMLFHAIMTIGLIAIIILQPGKSAGLGTIGGGGDKILGKKNKGIEPLLLKATVVLAAVFMVSAVVLSIFRG